MAGLGIMRALAPAASAPVSARGPADALHQRSEREKRKAALEALLALSAEEYVELAFEATSLSLFDEGAPPSVAVRGPLAAARAFDERHTKHSAACRRHLVNLEVTPTDLHEKMGYDQRLLDVRRNRFFVPEALGRVERIKARRRKKAR